MRRMGTRPRAGLGAALAFCYAALLAPGSGLPAEEPQAADTGEQTGWSNTTDLGLTVRMTARSMKFRSSFKYLTYIAGG